MGYYYLFSAIIAFLIYLDHLRLKRQAKNKRYSHPKPNILVRLVRFMRSKPNIQTAFKKELVLTPTYQFVENVDKAGG